MSDIPVKQNSEMLICETHSHVCSVYDFDGLNFCTSDTSLKFSVGVCKVGGHAARIPAEGSGGISRISRGFLVIFE